MEKERQLKILNDILSINTVNGNKNERELALYIQKLFKSHGITSSIDEIDEGRANIIGLIEGKDTDFLLFNGHLDTVPYGNKEAWITDPSKPVEREGKIYCRGASDMKSGLSAIVCAFCELAESSIKPEYTLVFLGTSDEEKGGTGAIKADESKIAEGAKALIIGEPTGNSICLAEKGCIWLTAKTKTRTSHSAYPEKGVNAIEVSYRFFERVSKFVSKFSYPLLGNSTASLNRIEGGFLSNMVPDECNFLIDIRPTSSLKFNILMKKIDQIIRDLKEEYSFVEINYSIENYRRPLEIERQNKIVNKFSKSIENVTNKEVKYIGINFFSDGSILSKNDTFLPVFMFGPGDPELAHQPNENVSIISYFEAIEIYLNFMK